MRLIVDLCVRLSVRPSRGGPETAAGTAVTRERNMETSLLLVWGW